MKQESFQKLSDDTSIVIEEEDLFVYYLQKIWPKYNLDFEQFKKLMQKKGIKLTNTNDLIAF